MVRVHGFERPFTAEQMASWVALPVAALIWYLIVGYFVLEESKRVPLQATFSVLLVLLVGFWLHCSVVDPKVDTGFYWPCMKEAQKETRYCPTCHKNVPGLDHHCAWLNTCIGRRQYPSFFFLVMIATFLFWYETAIFVLLLTLWYDPSRATQVLGSEVGYKVALSLATVYSGILACSLSILAVFHTFLQFQRMGTYAYMIEGRQRKADARDAKRRRAKERKIAQKEAKERGDQAPQSEWALSCCTSASPAPFQPANTASDSVAGKPLNPKDKDEQEVQVEMHARTSASTNESQVELQLGSADDSANSVQNGTRPSTEDEGSSVATI